MPIYANTFTVTGTVANIPVYANLLGMNGYSNLSVQSDLHVDGNVYSQGRLDFGSTTYVSLYPTLGCNITFGGLNERTMGSNAMNFDLTTTNIDYINSMNLAVQPTQVLDSNLGVIYMPTTGLFAIQLQASFSNSPTFSGTPVNGVYFKLPDSVHPNARVCPNFTPGDLVSTTFVSFLQGGTRIVPTFYSNDSNAVLMANNDETFVRFNVISTVTLPTHSNIVI